MHRRNKQSMPENKVYKYNNVKTKNCFGWLPSWCYRIPAKVRGDTVFAQKWTSMASEKPRQLRQIIVLEDGLMTS